MVNPYFISFELTMLVILALCFRHARRAGVPAIWQLFAGIAYGILLELVSIRQLHAYTYGQFTLMVLEVPVVIGLGWGIFIYGARLFSDATSLPEWARPILDALLVLAIDLAMDPVAIRLGMWDWRMDLRSNYFGVPHGNFWAWFWVVFSFSTGLRLFTRLPGLIGRWLAPLIAILIGLLTLILTNAIMAIWIPIPFRTITVVPQLLTALVAVLALRPRLERNPHPLAGHVSLITQSYFLIVGVVSGTLTQLPELLVIGLLVLGLSAYIYTRRLGPRASG